MKKGYMGIVLSTFLYPVLGFASHVTESNLNLDLDCYDSPVSHPITLSSKLPAFERSNLLEQRHPGGINNQIDGTNEDRGEGLPYHLILHKLVSEVSAKDQERSDSSWLIDLTESYESVMILRLLNDPALDDKDEFMGLFLPFARKSAPHPSNRILCRDVFKNIPPLSRSKILKLIGEWFPGETLYYATFLDFLNQASNQNFDEVLEKISPFIKDINKKIDSEFLKSAELNTLLNSFLALPKDWFWTEILDAAQPLLMKARSAFERGKIIESFRNIPLDPSAIEIVASLSGKEDVVEKIDFLESFSNFSQDQQNIIIQQVQPLFDLVPDLYKSIILKVLDALPEEQRTPFVNLVVSWFEGSPETWQDIATSDLFEDLSKQQTVAFISLTKHWPENRSRIGYLHHVKAKNDLFRFFVSLLTLSKDQRLELITFAQSLFKEDDSEYDKSTILNTLLNIPKDQLRDIVTVAQPWLQTALNANRKCHILKIFAALPQKDRVEFINITQPLRDSFEDRDNKIIILESLKDASSEKREEILCVAPLLLKDMKDWREKRSVLKALTTIPKGQYSDIFDMVWPLLKSAEDKEKSHILQAMIAIPRDERQEIVCIAQDLLEGIQEKRNESLILSTLNRFSKENRAEMIKLAQLLLKKMNNGAEIGLLLQSLARISPEKLINILDVAQTYIENFEGLEKAWFLDFLTHVSRDEAIDILKFAQPFWQREKNSKERLKILEAIRKNRNLTQNPEQAILDKIYQYIPKEQYKQISLQLTSLFGFNENKLEFYIFMLELMKTPPALLNQTVKDFSFYWQKYQGKDDRIKDSKLDLSNVLD